MMKKEAVLKVLFLFFALIILLVGFVNAGSGPKRLDEKCVIYLDGKDNCGICLSCKVNAEKKSGAEGICIPITAKTEDLGTCDKKGGVFEKNGDIYQIGFGAAYYCDGKGSCIQRACKTNADCPQNYDLNPIGILSCYYLNSKEGFSEEALGIFFISFKCILDKCIGNREITEIKNCNEELAVEPLNIKDSYQSYCYRNYNREEKQYQESAISKTIRTCKDGDNKKTGVCELWVKKTKELCKPPLICVEQEMLEGSGIMYAMCAMTEKTDNKFTYINSCTKEKVSIACNENEIGSNDGKTPKCISIMS